MAEINIHGSTDDTITQEEYIKQREKFSKQLDDDDDNIVSDSDYDYSMSDVMSDDDKKRGRRKKVNVLSLITSLTIAGVPMVIKSVRQKREGLPTKLSRADMLKLATITVMPTIMAADDVFNKGKLQDKTGDTLSHIRNISNVISMYPDGYQMINNMSIQNRYKNKVKNNQAATVPISVGNSNSGLKLFTKSLNLFSPYIIDTMCTKDMPFMEKVSSVMPVTVVGHLVQKFAQANPATRRVYETVANSLRAGSVVVNGVGSAVRQSKHNGGTVNKGLSTFQTLIESTGDILGVKTRQNQYGYNNGFNNGFGNFNNNYWNN